MARIEAGEKNVIQFDTKLFSTNGETDKIIYLCVIELNIVALDRLKIDGKPCFLPDLLLTTCGKLIGSL